MVGAFRAFTEILVAPQATEGRQQVIPPPPPSGPPPGRGNAHAGQVAFNACLLGTVTGVGLFRCIVGIVRVLLGVCQFHLGSRSHF